MLVLYGITIFISAALLFLVQPMAAKLVLPLLGGTPAVWTTSMLFFQAALLAGYGYAHALARYVPAKAQLLVHIIVIGLAIAIALPIGLPTPVPMPPAAHGGGAAAELAFYLLKLLAVSVGLPFFVVSTTGPLLQSWFSRTGHRQAADPYFLYAASNAGSFIGLLAYPFVIEPWLELRDQERFWSMGFGLFGLLVLSCAGGQLLSARRAAARPAPIAAEAAAPDPAPPTLGRRLRWILLSAVPSSLLLGATQHISTDVAAMPLLWVVPLGLYLLTFVLVFSKWFRVGPALLGVLAGVAILGVCLASGLHLRKPIVWLIVLHLSAFFLTSLVCHKRLADDRPHASRLTEYYLLMSLGGMIGGLFNGLLAPAIFPDVLEYPIALVLGCVLRPGMDIPRIPRRVTGIVAAAAMVAVLASLAIGISIQRGQPVAASDPAVETGLSPGDLWRVVIPVCMALAAIPRAWPLGLSVAAIIGVMRMAPDYSRERFLFQERSFYGVHRVKDSLDGRQRVLMHGTTAHGMQNRDEPGKGTRWELTPTSYYHPSGPLGQMFSAFVTTDPRRIDRVGIIGLGVGSVAAYARQGANFTFYEIDDVVIRIAGDPLLFSFLKNAGERVGTRLGDGRLSLAAEPDGEFGVVILDAFSSDSVPTHLLTREAVAMYISKLRPDGVLAVHITNLHFDMKPVLARIAAELSIAAIVQEDGKGDVLAESQGHLGSTWALLARDRKHLRPMIDDLGRWRSLEAGPDDPLWTDSYSSLVRVLKR